MPVNRRPAPIWLMGLSNTTFGLVAGCIVLPLPQLLAAQGISPAKIAAVSSACLFPGFWVFFLGPVLDLRFTRRAYATGFALLAGALLASAILLRAHLLALEVTLMLSYAAAVMSSNALGGWLAGILPVDPSAPAEKQDRRPRQPLRLDAGGQLHRQWADGRARRRSPAPAPARRSRAASWAARHLARGHLSLHAR